MKQITLLFLFCLFFSTSNAQIIKTKDGFPIGERSAIIKSCTSEIDGKYMNFKELTVQKEKYCSCMVDNLFPNITSIEILEAKNKNEFEAILLKEDNYKILMECIEPNIEIREDFIFTDETESGLYNQSLTINACIIEMKSIPDINTEIWNDNTIEDFCTCATNKLYEKGYSYKEILEIENENSQTHNEILMPCLNEIISKNEVELSDNKYTHDDISGETQSSKIPLIDLLGNGYNLKIKIGNQTKYFLLDTGASYLSISEEMERELILDGIIDRNDYLEEQELILANGDTIKARMVNLSNIKIGDYTVSNIKTVILKNGSLLCGKGLLDKFKTWEIDPENNELILYK